MNIEIPDILDIQPTPEQYILDDKLKLAVQTALRFNQPLLLTGEPGTGKTQLAYKVAHQLNEQTKDNPKMAFSATPLRFNTKTTSQARDLFYLYDAIGHFQQANTRSSVAGEAKDAPLRPLSDFIELQALGLGIALANPNKDYHKIFKFKEKPDPAVSSVVLIDEVDKAPRDFTNDILNEIENREFSVKEQGDFKVELDKANTQRLLVIMTSNSEKNLPEAFLRRCVFYNIPTPEGARLRGILKAHLVLPKEKKQQELLEANLTALTDEFELLRKKATRKSPATAELVAVVKLLSLDEGFFTKEIKDIKKIFRDNISLLIKTKEDIEAIRDFLKMP